MQTCADLGVIIAEDKTEGPDHSRSRVRNGA